MSFDIDFQPKGPEAIQERIAELRGRLGIKDPKEFNAALAAAKNSVPMMGNIGSGPVDLRGEDVPLGGMAPYNPGPPPRKVEVQALIARVAKEQGVSEKLIRAVVEAESSYNTYDVSLTGAKGLMQLMPGTAEEMGVKDPFNPYENLTGGTKYLKQMMARFPGRTDLALAAYNAGPGKVERAGGIPEIAETRNYVKKIMTKLNER
jgi:soluble lytic murein transglycosylase-like protein